jgi:hypothetical protein
MSEPPGPSDDAVVWWTLVYLSSVILLFNRTSLLSTLLSLWTSFRYYNPFFGGFMYLVSLIEQNVTAEFFIYCMFLPFAYIPTILINQAGRYNMPYYKYIGKRRGRTRRRRRSTGAHLARYLATLRIKSTIVTSSKGDHRNFRSIYNKRTASKRCFSTTAWFSTTTWHSTLYSCLSTIDPFLHSFNVIDHFHTIKSLLPSSQYKCIHPSSSHFKRILLEAKGLQTSAKVEPTTVKDDAHKAEAEAEMGAEELLSSANTPVHADDDAAEVPKAETLENTTTVAGNVEEVCVC